MGWNRRGACLAGGSCQAQALQYAALRCDSGAAAAACQRGGGRAAAADQALRPHAPLRLAHAALRAGGARLAAGTAALRLDGARRFCAVGVALRVRLEQAHHRGLEAVGVLDVLGGQGDVALHVPALAGGVGGWVEGGSTEQ